MDGVVRKYMAVIIQHKQVQYHNMWCDNNTTFVSDNDLIHSADYYVNCDCRFKAQ